MTPVRFRKIVLKHYQEHGRHTLPWRKTHDPYKILVSEVMLQQTQVERVIPFYTAWIKTWPTPAVLAQASLAEVLNAWQGLGYNRRAKMLHEAAKLLVREHGGTMPKTVEGLQQLPGVGPYTARAVATFAYDQRTVFIETNLRTAVTHHFFAEHEKVSDADVLAVLERALPKPASGIRAREWYSALMDYGAQLKRSGVRINKKSTGYTKQAAFKGSGREVRGAIVRALLAGPATETRLLKLFTNERAPQARAQLVALLAEGLVVKDGRCYRLPA